MTDIAIIIPVYKRLFPLKRLLILLSKANFIGQSVDLIISKEYNATIDVSKICEEFHWEHGGKNIITHKESLGLKRHLLFCGEISKNFDWIIVIEDDISVSPGFFKYAYDTIDKYRDDPKISGISLHSYIFNEIALVPFFPIKDSFDVYFIQSASSWGQAWTCKMWNGFYEWYLEKMLQENIDFSVLSDKMISWGNNSWKKLFNLYMIERDKYFVVPRYGYTTNLGEAGTHYSVSSTHNASSLSIEQYPALRYPSSMEDGCIYDAYFEITPDTLKRFCPYLFDINFSVDLTGQRPLRYVNTDILITSRFIDSLKNYDTFGFSFYPPEINIIMSEIGRNFAFTSVGNCSPCANSVLINKMRNYFIPKYGKVDK